MVSAMSPMLSYESRLQERLAAMENQKQRQQDEQLPAYSEVMKGQSPVEVNEKELVSEPKKPSKRAALKRFFQSDESSRSQSVDSSSSTSSSKSTLKMIATGEVYKYHPIYRLEEAAMATQMRNQS